MTTFQFLSTIMPVVLLAFLAASPESRADANLLGRLGSLEISDKEFRSAFSPTDAERVTLDSSKAYKGKKSIRLGNPDRKDYGAGVTAPVAGVGPRILDISAAVKADNIIPGNLGWLSGRIYAQAIDKEGKLGPVQEIGEPSRGTFDWRKVSRLITVPNGSQAVRISMTLNGCMGAIRFDDIRVVDKTDMWKRPESKTATISIDPKRVVGKLSPGIGWNWETVMPKHFTPEEAAAWDDLFARMASDGTDWIRVGVDSACYVPLNFEPGKDSGQAFDYQVDNRLTRQLCRLFEQCDKLGIPVLLCNWGTTFGYEGIADSWWYAVGGDTSNPAVQDWRLPYSDERFVEGYCALIKYLKIDKGFDCIKYVSIWNEPDWPWVMSGNYKRFFSVYDLLDAKLKALGLRDKVRILGPETVAGPGSAVEESHNVVAMGKQVDMFALHQYFPGLPSPTDLAAQAPNQRGADDFAEAIRILKKAGRADTPVLLTELGAFGTDVAADARAQFMCTLGICDYIIRCAKTGVGGFLRWQYSDFGDTQYHAFRLKDGKVSVNNAIYPAYAMFTRWTAPDSKVLATRVTGGKDGLGIGRVEAAAVKAPSGFMSILAVNSGKSAKKVKIDLPKAEGRAWRLYSYDSTLPESVARRDVKVEKGRLVVELPAESVNVITDRAD